MNPFPAYPAGGNRTEFDVAVDAIPAMRIAFAVWTTGRPFDAAKVGIRACKKP